MLGCCLGASSSCRQQVRKVAAHAGVAVQAAGVWQQESNGVLATACLPSCLHPVDTCWQNTQEGTAQESRAHQHMHIPSYIHYMERGFAPLHHYRMVHGQSSMCRLQRKMQHKMHEVKVAMAHCKLLL
jgi:hypothetical protein